jgi:uncharacterized membrane protein YhhN
VTATAWIFLAVVGVLAVADWIAVSPGVRAKRVEYVLKPGTLLALIVVAVAIQPENGAQRAVFVAALVLSLAGDVFLMLPRDLFVAGLASFLLAHLAYIVGFAIGGLTAGLVIAGLAVVAIAAGMVGIPIVRNVASKHRRLIVPVVTYMTAISAMVVLSLGSGEPLAIVGALLFYCSDSLIAWDRFVTSLSWGRPAIMSTYHLAQAALVLSLLR